MLMLRKHPEILALSVIGLALLASAGIDRSKAMRRHPDLREPFQVRELVLDSGFPERANPAREGILVFKEALRDSLRGLFRR